MQTNPFDGSHFNCRRDIVRLLLACSLIVPASSIFAAEATKAWSGTWSNKKFNTTGALTCTVIGEQNGQWIARFTGTGLGRPFTYVAYITPKGSGTSTNLTGVTKVEGDSYQWSGTVSGQSMTGSFRSGQGNNGDFRLQAAKAPAAAPMPAPKKPAQP